MHARNALDTVITKLSHIPAHNIILFSLILSHAKAQLNVLPAGAFSNQVTVWSLHRYESFFFIKNKLILHTNDASKNCIPSANQSAANTPANPTLVSPVQTQMTLTDSIITLQPNSYTVIVMHHT